MRTSRPWVLGLIGCLTVLTPGTAQALPVTFSDVLNFSASTQSIWGPGGSALSFGASDTLGSALLGISYSTKASSGTVSANFDGRLSATLSSDIIRLDQPTTIKVDFTGLAGGGLLGTDLGASINVTALVLGGSFCIYCADYLLSINRRFTPQLDVGVTGSDEFPAVEPGIDAGFLGVHAKAGVSLDVKQTASLTGTAIRGSLVARSRLTGETLVTPVAINTAVPETLTLAFEQRGPWDLQFVNLMLDNTFFTSFDLDLRPFVEFTCFFCSDHRADFSLADVRLFDSPRFGLAFSTFTTDVFSIDVIPLPPTWLLMVLGVGVTGVARRFTMRHRPRRTGRR